MTAMGDENLSEREEQLRGALYLMGIERDELATRVGECEQRFKKSWLASRDELVQRAEAAEAKVKELEREVQHRDDLITDIDAHATPWPGPGAAGFTTGYTMPVGPLHRALGYIGGKTGVPIQTCQRMLRDAEARAERYREALERMREAGEAVVQKYVGSIRSKETVAKGFDEPLNTLIRAMRGAESQEGTNDLGEGKLVAVCRRCHKPFGLCQCPGPDASFVMRPQPEGSSGD